MIWRALDILAYFPLQLLILAALGLLGIFRPWNPEKLAPGAEEIEGGGGDAIDEMRDS
jgi:hypothetical protein